MCVMSSQGDKTECVSSNAGGVTWCADRCCRCVVAHCLLLLLPLPVTHPQDLMMPEVDGLDILRYVRSNIQLAGLPVISECVA